VKAYPSNFLLFYKKIKFNKKIQIHQLKKIALKFRNFVTGLENFRFVNQLKLIINYGLKIKKIF
jgi:hypothetical protein